MDVNSLQRTKKFRNDQITLNPEGIRVAFDSTSKLAKPLTQVKDSVPQNNAGQLVYNLSCQDCTTVYIGETSRSVANRMEEHLPLIKKHPKNNEERKKTRTQLSYSPSCPRNGTTCGRR